MEMQTFYENSWLRVGGVRRREIIVEALGAVWIGLLFGDEVQNGVEEAAVLSERCGVVGSEGGFHGTLRGRRDELDAADEDSRELGGSGSDGQRKNRVQVLAGDDVEEAAAFFKP